MSYALSSFVNCENIQEQLNDHFLCDYTQTLKNNETSLTQFLMSPANTNNILQKMISPGGGKVKNATLVYTPRIPKGGVGTSIDKNDCASTNKFGDREEDYTIDTTVGSSIDRIIDMQDLIRRCEDFDAYAVRMLMSMMDAAIRRMDETNANQIIALAGSFGEGETNVTAGYKTVRTRTSASDNRMVSNFISDIEFASMNAGYCGAPVAFVWNDVLKVAQELRASNCCNDNGMNLAELKDLSGITFIPSRNVTGALGGPASNRFLVMDPGQVQMLSYLQYENAGQYMTINDTTYKQTVITHPQTGIKFDLRMKFDCGKWHVFIELAHKLVGIPSDIYEDEDIYAGVTGVNKYDVSNS